MLNKLITNRIKLNLLSTMHFSQEANRVISQNQQSHGQTSLLKLLKEMTSSQQSTLQDSPTSKMGTPVYQQMHP
jgi:hypothetical protein